MLYTQRDTEENRSRVKREGVKMVLCALPFVAMAVAGFILRNELLCAAGCILLSAMLIFTTDLCLMPVVRYGRFLRDIHNGLQRTTVGTLVRLGEDEVYEDGVYFSELMINIYENMSEEGERRFLLDRSKPRPQALLGGDVRVTSQGSIVLDVEPLSGQEVQA